MDFNPKFPPNFTEMDRKRCWKVIKWVQTRKSKLLTLRVIWFKAERVVGSLHKSHFIAWIIDGHQSLMGSRPQPLMIRSGWCTSSFPNRSWMEEWTIQIGCKGILLSFCGLSDATVVLMHQRMLTFVENSTLEKSRDLTLFIIYHGLLSWPINLWWNFMLSNMVWKSIKLKRVFDRKKELKYDLWKVNLERLRLDGSCWWFELEKSRDLTMFIRDTMGYSHCQLVLW